MDNDIKVILKGQAAYDYIRNDSLLTSAAAKVNEENAELTLRILELEAELETLKAEVSDYSLKAAIPARLKRDTELARDSQYEKQSPFKKPIVKKPDPIDTIDIAWRAFVDAGVPATNTRKSKWTEDDTLVVKNAIDKTDLTYYSIATLAKLLSRSADAIRTKAILSCGASVRDGMLISKIKQ